MEGAWRVDRGRYQRVDPLSKVAPLPPEVLIEVAIGSEVEGHARVLTH